MARSVSAAKVTQAISAWANAPVSVKIMAGAYAAPMVDALQAMNRELHRLSADVEDLATDARVIGGGE